MQNVHNHSDINKVLNRALPFGEVARRSVSASAPKPANYQVRIPSPFTLQILSGILYKTVSAMVSGDLSLLYLSARFLSVASRAFLLPYRIFPGACYPRPTLQFLTLSLLLPQLFHYHFALKMVYRLCACRAYLCPFLDGVSKWRSINGK